MHNIILNMEQYIILNYGGKIKKGFILYARRLEGGDATWCSAPEPRTAAFEGPKNCTFKMWDIKQIKSVTILRVMAYSSATVGIQCRPTLRS